MRLALASSICMICDWHSEMYSCVYWTCPSNIPITQFSSPISLSSCQQLTPWDYTLILANIMQGQRNHETKQDTRRVFFYFKVNSHVLTLPSLIATSLLRQNLSNFLQTLSLSCNKAQANAWLIYKILTIIHKLSELFKIALYK